MSAEQAQFKEEVARLLPQELIKRYPRESALHRELLFKRGARIAPEWRDFRRFLSDVGVCPSEAHAICLNDATDPVFGPGRAAWALPQAQVRLTPAQQREAEIEAWKNQLEQRPAHKADQGVTVQSLMRASAEPAQGPASAASAGSLIDEAVDWLPPDQARRDAFFKAYRAWHAQILPQYSRAATPAFLFVFSAVCVLWQCREELSALDLWEPLGERAHQAREAHPAWKKYCEFLPRAAIAILQIDTYRDYSLFTQLEDLRERVVKAERRFREGPEKAPQKAPEQHLRARAGGH